jgi:hypothetical protein
VRSVFAAAGATNVAWVWAPADPQDDRLKIDSIIPPPESDIDVVMQPMIRYPNTPWPDATKVLQAVGARHPTKPLFVEVSAAGDQRGDPQVKAAWLRSVAAAAAKDPHVYALVYHDGAPDLRATKQENKAWSIDSDPLSLQAVRTWRALHRRQPGRGPVGGRDGNNPHRRLSLAHPS